MDSQSSSEVWQHKIVNEDHLTRSSKQGNPTSNQGINDSGGGPDSDGHQDKVAESDGMAIDLNPLAKAIGQDSSSSGTQILESALDRLPHKWKNFTIRFIFGWLMIGGSLIIVYGGPLCLVCLVLFIQVKCFSEVINIGYVMCRVDNLPWIRSMSWYFLLISNYFLYGESTFVYFGILVNKINLLTLLVRYHRFISFSLYTIGFVWFVKSIHGENCRGQFCLFAWIHVALLIVVMQLYLAIQNLFEGIIWLVLPVCMIVINDIMAYWFGFFLGQTPLIKLSPKKTWEGYLGGVFTTVILSMTLASFLTEYQYFICPVEFNENLRQMTHYNCEPAHVFVLKEYPIPGILASREIIPLSGTVRTYPLILHAFLISLFASVIGPFGGFFASGLKRAFKIKNFGHIFPGHGGFLDRCDCQFLMATFVNAYIHSFVKSASPTDIFQRSVMLKPEEQLALYYALQDDLKLHRILL